MLPEGFLNINKPVGPSSHDIVRLLKRTFKIDKTFKLGHTGTLDPPASGVLVICLGRANRLAEYVLRHPKEYIAFIRLGTSTDTLDSAGQIIETKSIPGFEQSDLDTLIPKFTGKITQIPPAISALKIDGERYYAKAKRGEPVEPPARETTVYEVKLEKESESSIRLYVKCKSGFYVRSLARDIALELGTVGLLDKLVRLSVGDFKIGDSVSCDEIESIGIDSIGSKILPIDSPMGVIDNIHLDHNNSRGFLHGWQINLEQPRDFENRQELSVYYGELFLGVGRVKKSADAAILMPEKVIAKIEEMRKNR